MSTNYTWKIAGLKARTEESDKNSAVQTYWKKTGTIGEFSGATPFSTKIKFIQEF